MPPDRTDVAAAFNMLQAAEGVTTVHEIVNFRPQPTTLWRLGKFMLHQRAEANKMLTWNLKSYIAIYALR